MKVIIASENKGKIKEFKAVLEPLGFSVETAKDVGVDLSSVVEDGTTYEENARIKAKFLFEKTGRLSMADDSGLDIAALPDLLGIYSARFMGHETAYTEKNAAILAMMQGVSNRHASFSSAIAVYGVDIDLIFTGTCEGSIANVISGHHGFGYDPIFIPKGYDKSFADLDSSVKNEISHRAQALFKMNTYFKKVCHEE